jgi:hypothetical protein
MPRTPEKSAAACTGDAKAASSNVYAIDPGKPRVRLEVMPLSPAHKRPEHAASTGTSPAARFLRPGGTGYSVQRTGASRLEDRRTTFGETPT